MHRKLHITLTLIGVLICARCATAHFPWLTVSDQGKVALFFGETPADQTYKLPASIKRAKVNILREGDDTAELKMISTSDKEFVGLASEEKVSAASTVFTSVTYGIYNGSRLNYYAIHYGGRLPRRNEAPSASIPLNLQAQVVNVGGGIDVIVNWQGKPLTEAKVTLFCEEGHDEGSANTDKNGRVSFTDEQVEDGLNGIMVGHTAKDESGEVDGKAYSSAAHYLTVTFQDPRESSKQAQSAEILRKQAHASRAVWQDFPGFTADVVVRRDNNRYRGTIRVASDFSYELEIAKEAREPWLKSKLRSVISHRRPSEPRDYDVTFADRGAGHISGRLIAENDGSGVFRIKDDQIQEVIRKSDATWFEITNLDVLKTDTGHFLPRATSVTYRNPKSGDIESNRSNRFGWKRVGGFYLPEHSLTIETGKGGARTVRMLQFSKHKLSEPKSDAAATSKAG